MSAKTLTDADIERMTEQVLRSRKYAHSRKKWQ